MLNNPFEIILTEVKALRGDISKLTVHNSPLPAEIIDRKTLCDRLKISEPTAIKLGKRQGLPEIRVGESIRYNWGSVLEFLERKKNKSISNRRLKTE